MRFQAHCPLSLSSSPCWTNMEGNVACGRAGVWARSASLHRRSVSPAAVLCSVHVRSATTEAVMPGEKVSIPMTEEEIQKYGNFDIFLEPFNTSFSALRHTPHTRRVTCSAYCSYLLDADWCLRCCAQYTSSGTPPFSTELRRCATCTCES